VFTVDDILRSQVCGRGVMLLGIEGEGEGREVQTMMMFERRGVLRRV
jgi:hypothetical protein